MRQRLGLAAALLRPRELLVLDEPTNGLDPQGTREVRSLVRELAADGTTVFLSTHLLAEVEQICSHVAVMSDGRLVAQGPLAEVTAASAPQLQVGCRRPDRAVAVLQGLGLDGVRVDAPDVRADLGAADPERVLAELVAGGAGVHEFGVRRSTLEELFVALTGEGFDVRH
jgi:ABC-2 type transport system ATP-binding protein